MIERDNRTGEPGGAGNEVPSLSSAKIGVGSKIVAGLRGIKARVEFFLEELADLDPKTEKAEYERLKAIRDSWLRGEG